MTPQAPATHVLFDMDGLLLDTETIYTEITRDIVAPYGKTFDWDLKCQIIGRPALDSAKFLVKALQLPMDAQTFLDQRNVLLHDRFICCKAMPGAERLVRHLHRHKIPMAVATSSSRELMKIKMTAHTDWCQLFDLSICVDDPEVINGKPAPDIFLIGASRLGAEPASTLVFEDSPTGLQAGLAANMRVIAVPDPNMDKSHYSGANLIIDSLSEFPFQTYGLPAF